jgi:hypothetical protein
MGATRQWIPGLAMIGLMLFAGCGGGGGVAAVQGDSQDATPVSNGDGDCLTLLAQSVTTDADGNVTTIVDFAYDVHANLIRIEEFDLLTATTRRVTYFVHPGLIEEDDGADGVVDRRYHLERDAAGRVVVESLDEGADDVTDRVRSMVYDAAGDLIRIEEDTDMDGLADVVRILLYAPGNVLTTELHDQQGDGTVDDVVDYIYDSRDRLAERRLDLGDDGIADEVVTYTYDAEDRVFTESLDADGDGVPERVTTHFYNTTICS